MNKECYVQSLRIETKIQNIVYTRTVYGSGLKSKQKNLYYY